MKYLIYEEMIALYKMTWFWLHALVHGVFTFERTWFFSLCILDVCAFRSGEGNIWWRST